MGSIEQKRGMLAVKRRLDEISARPNKAGAVNAFAAEMAERDTRIRNGFAAIFEIAGDEILGPHTRQGHIIETHHINLGAEEVSGALGVRLSAKLAEPDSTRRTFDPIEMRFYNDEKFWATERYNPNTPTGMLSVVAAGGDYYRTSRDMLGSAHYLGYQDDFYALEQSMYGAEYWQGQILQALGDVSLNPTFARVANAQT